MAYKGCQVCMASRVWYGPKESKIRFMKNLFDESTQKIQLS